jgi:hypothetical protein
MGRHEPVHQIFFQTSLRHSVKSERLQDHRKNLQALTLCR